MLEKLAKTRQAYENHYLKRKIQTYEKYTLEHDVMFSSMKKPESKKYIPLNRYLEAYYYLALWK